MPRSCPLPACAGARGVVRRAAGRARIADKVAAAAAGRRESTGTRAEAPGPSSAAPAGCRLHGVRPGWQGTGMGRATAGSDREGGQRRLRRRVVPSDRILAAGCPRPKSSVEGRSSPDPIGFALGPYHLCRERKVRRCLKQFLVVYCADIKIAIYK